MPVKLSWKKKEYDIKVEHYGKDTFNSSSEIKLIQIGEQENVKYYSSLREMNFYKWIMETGMYDYIVHEYDEINYKYQQYLKNL